MHKSHYINTVYACKYLQIDLRSIHFFSENEFINTSFPSVCQHLNAVESTYERKVTKILIECSI